MSSRQAIRSRPKRQSLSVTAYMRPFTVGPRLRAQCDSPTMLPMIGLLQRVTEAAVRVDGAEVAAIGTGLLVLVGVERGDGEAQARRLAERLLGYRVFPDDRGRMNASVLECGGALLLVPQFTLAADTRKGMRASFTPAADPDTGQRLFEYLGECARAAGAAVQCGTFGADMQVSLVNDGPVTFWLHVPPTG